MRLTPIFNAAANGNDGEAASANIDPSPHNPTGSLATIADAQEAQTAPPSSAHFGYAADPTDRPDLDDEQPYGRRLSAEDAEAELEMLEAGRAEPAPRNNLRPSTNLLRIVDTKVERDREARIRALSAYLEFKEQGPELQAEHQADDSLDLIF